MLAWEVMVYRNPKVSLWRSVVRGLSRVFYREPRQAKLGPLVARWHTSFFGINWIEQLVQEGKATDHGGYGYPSKYTLTADVLLPILNAGLPTNDSPIVIGDDYVLPAKWSGEIIWDNAVASACKPDDVLTIHAWDQS
jgi:hypothetical protein